MSAPLFKPHQRVVHIYTGSVYRIVDPPTRLRVWLYGDLAYSFTLAQGDDITLWVLSQQQMEDGQFRAEGP